jgi:DNA-binding NtrC family response regulator
MKHAILFVDDDENILAAFRRSFHKTFDITTVGNAVEAMKLILAGRQFTVIVSDLCMPGVDGLRLLNQIRRQAPFTRRLMLSGNADMTNAVKALKGDEIDRFLTKPCPPDRLAKAIHEAIDHYERDMKARRPAAPRQAERLPQAVRPGHLMAGDVLLDDLVSTAGTVLLRRQQTVTEDILPRLLDLAAHKKLADSILIQREKRS